VPKDLKRFYHNGDLHFITCSCYQRHRWLNSAKRRDLFLHILEQTRVRYRFVVLGYVVTPEHFHLMISEPEIGGGWPTLFPTVRVPRSLRFLQGAGRFRHDSFLSERVDTLHLCPRT
jgi:hypothetical protein